jgi:urea transport system ATP-binding protein
MLNVNALNVFYGESHTIRDVSLSVGAQEAVAVMGRNGMGKTTLFKTIIGMLPTRSGEITLDGISLQNQPSYRRGEAGRAVVPPGRMIFNFLTVKEKIQTGTEKAPLREVPDYIYEYFPVLGEMENRKGGNLSGGQQQMLAIARALVSNPKVLILDEPTEGIQPSIIKELAQTLVTLRRERGISILISEQVLSFALEVADRFLVIDRGRIVDERRRDDAAVEDIREFLKV